MRRGLAALVVSLAASMLPGCREEAQQNVQAPPSPPSICAPEMQRYEVVSTEDVRQRGNYIVIEVVPRYATSGMTQEAILAGLEPRINGWNFHATYQDDGRIDSIGYHTLQELTDDFKGNLAKERGLHFTGAILHVYRGGFDEERRCQLANGLGIPYIAWGSPSGSTML